MRTNCLDEGTLQAYIDGELVPAARREAEAHLARCASCAEARTAAEGELALFASAFAPDASVSVPTDVLRRRLDAAVGELQASTPTRRGTPGTSLKGLLGALAGLLSVTPQRAAAFASLIAVLAFAALFAFIQMRQPGRNPSTPTDNAHQEVAVVGPPSPVVERPAPASTSEGGEGVTPTGVSLVKVRSTRPTKAAPRRQVTARASAGTKDGAVTAPEETMGDAAVAQKSVPGEENYQQAIASLARAIDASGDAVLKPAMRADYERNIAVVDKAIDETRRAALRNPQDPAATAFLFSAYQSKIDLLMAVADQAQSSALGR